MLTPIAQAKKWVKEGHLTFGKDNLLRATPDVFDAMHLQIPAGEGHHILPKGALETFVGGYGKSLEVLSQLRSQTPGQSQQL